jgi:bifunctional DNA-binding transcriptional regulator/antitoxin component of YhaV-PrlF toxin-antitoxin module
MNSTGRVTLPAETRRALGLDGESFFEVAVDRGVIVLRPVAIVPRDQARPAASDRARR